MEYSGVNIYVGVASKEEQEKFYNKYIKKWMIDQPRLSDKEIKKLFKQYGKGGYKKRGYMMREWSLMLRKDRLITWFDKLLEFFDFSPKSHKGNFVWEGNKVVFKRCRDGKFTCIKNGNTTNITIN